MRQTSGVPPTTEQTPAPAVSHGILATARQQVLEEGRGLDETQVLDLARSTPLRNASLSRLVRDDAGTWSMAAYDEVTHLHDAGLDVTEHQGERHAKS